MICPLNKARLKTQSHHPHRLLSPAQRTQVEDEEKLVPVLQMLIKKSVNKAAMEAALCLGFLRPCSNIAREYLLQCLCQGPKTQQMKVGGPGGLPGEHWGNSADFGGGGLDPVMLIPGKRSFGREHCSVLCVLVTMDGQEYAVIWMSVYTCLCLVDWSGCTFMYIHLCAHMHMCSCSRGKEGRERTPPAPYTSSPQVCLAIQKPPGPVYPTLPCPPHRHLVCWSR